MSKRAMHHLRVAEILDQLAAGEDVPSETLAEALRYMHQQYRKQSKELSAAWEQVETLCLQAHGVI